jgi:hypothetical protein
MTGKSYLSWITQGAYNYPATSTDEVYNSNTGLASSARQLYNNVNFRTADGKGLPTQGRFYVLNGTKCIIRAYYLPEFNQYDVVNPRDLKISQNPWVMAVGNGVAPPFTGVYNQSSFCTPRYEGISMYYHVGEMHVSSGYRNHLISGKKCSADIGWDTAGTLVGGILPGMAYLNTSSITDEGVTSNAPLDWNEDPTAWTGHTMTYINIEVD